MDIKTLEILKLRVLQAEEIVEKIEELKRNIEAISFVDNVRFYDELDVVFDTTIGGLVEQMKTAYVQAAQEEIVLLEQELAEL